MNDSNSKRAEETLDPDNWQALRDLGHRMVDDAMDYLETVRERPVWQPISDSVKAKFTMPLPRKPEEEDAVYQEFLTNIFPYPMGNIHPRFWGWVVGTGTPLGMLSEMLAACMNPNLGGTDHVPMYVEEQVLAWCREMIGFPEDTGALLVSGCSMANLVGLTVARNDRAQSDIRRKGVYAMDQQMVLYSSTESHSSIQKAVELLGLGAQSLRKIPVNSDYSMDIAKLEEAVATDLKKGF